MPWSMPTACWRPYSPRTIDARLEQSGDLAEGGMTIDAGRQTRQADHRRAGGKARNAGDRILELDRIALALRHHDGDDGEPALPHDVERGEAVTDGAEIAADGEQQRDLERSHPVEHRAGAFERHHDAADAFDEQHAIGGLDGRSEE